MALAIGIHFTICVHLAADEEGLAAVATVLILAGIIDFFCYLFRFIVIVVLVLCLNTNFTFGFPIGIHAIS